MRGRRRASAAVGGLLVLGALTGCAQQGGPGATATNGGGAAAPSVTEQIWTPGYGQPVTAADQMVGSWMLRAIPGYQGGLQVPQNVVIRVDLTAGPDPAHAQLVTSADCGNQMTFPITLAGGHVAVGAPTTTTTGCQNPAVDTPERQVARTLRSLVPATRTALLNAGKLILVGGAPGPQIELDPADCTGPLVEQSTCTARPVGRPSIAPGATPVAPVATPLPTGMPGGMPTGTPGGVPNGMPGGMPGEMPAGVPSAGGVPVQPPAAMAPGVEATTPVGPPGAVNSPGDVAGAWLLEQVTAPGGAPLAPPTVGGPVRVDFTTKDGRALLITEAEGCGANVTNWATSIVAGKVAFSMPATSAAGCALPSSPPRPAVQALAQALPAVTDGAVEGNRLHLSGPGGTSIALVRAICAGAVAENNCRPVEPPALPAGS